MNVKLIAELSSNFMGDISLARDMIYAAKEFGADYVKFQIWKTKRLKKGPWDTDGRKEQYVQSELSDQKVLELKEICDSLNIKFLASCFDYRDLEFISTITNEIKIPGIECNNHILMEKAIDMFDIVYLSTCGSKESEYLEYIKNDHIYLLHGVYLYPCPANKVNIRRLLYLKQLTNHFGYSGHYFGIWDAIAAISLGAQVIEKHFTINRNLSFRDNKFSILPNELKQIREYADDYVQMMIDHGKDYQNAERLVRDTYARRWTKS